MPKKLHLDVSDRTVEALDQECKRLGILTRAELVRRILDTYITDTAPERAKLPKKKGIA